MYVLYLLSNHYVLLQVQKRFANLYIFSFGPEGLSGLYRICCIMSLIFFSLSSVIFVEQISEIGQIGGNTMSR
jgi:hypothetical protein